VDDRNMNDDARAAIESIARTNGAVAFGVADLRQVSLDEVSAFSGEVALSGFSTGISYGCRLNDSVVDGVIDHPTRTYQYHYRQVNLLLDHIGLLVASYIQQRGRRVFPVPASQIVDWKTYRGHVSHKAVGRLAGLGWIGRSNLLVNRAHGARLRLATVLTDLQLPCDLPVEGDCGKCRSCIAACPGGAIGDAITDYDLERCVSTIDSVRRAENIGSKICGICVRACKGKPAV
jgi:epoxyqueuosine reductase